jgi:predicted O-linked N-acetylglucosamine transferase (SPINDLY family)
MSVEAAVEALERRDQTVASIARICGLPEADVVLDVASRYWSWGEADRAIPLLEEQLGRAGSVVLQMAYLRCLISLADENPARVKRAVADLHALLRRRFSGPATLDLSDLDLRADRKLRLGFLCTYSNLKPVEFSLIPMFRAIDRAQFHTSFFSLDQDGHPLLDEVCDQHVVLRDCSAQAACDAIRSRKIDLLFDLNGILREDFPIEIFGMRAAPVQAGWWNTPVSSGLDTVQYFLTDRTSIGPQNDDMFTETIIEIPNGATLCYELSDRQPVAPAPCLRSNEFVLGSFTALFKINDVVLDGWAQILARAPNTRLLIKTVGSCSVWVAS